MYGDRVVKTGSESSIVYTGGVAEMKVTLKEMIHRMYSQSTDELFVFDTTILSSIPELIEDIAIPAFYQHWDNADNETEGRLWHMLSFGPSQTGIL